MTRDEIIEMAREADLWVAGQDPYQEQIERFAALVEQRASKPETAAEPVAWRTFDGEGGYDYRDFYQNEAYELEWKRRNPARADWVTPLYARPPHAAWRPASDPPGDGRNVIVWYTPNDPAKGAPGGLFSGFFRDGEWWPYSGSETVTHWRDVPPPTTEGE
jgi:hypothetical protein